MNETDRWLRGLLGDDAAIGITGKCHDCKGTVDILVTRKDDDYEIDGAFPYKIAGIEKPFFKCAPCYEIQPKLRDFQPCEVYSRIVGYLRPVKQWNKGKQQEFKERVLFKNNG
jgi:hypothetical protein